MNYDKFVFTTITYGRDAIEEKRIREGLQILSSKKIPIIIAADGGSTQKFIEKLKEIPQIQVVEPSEKKLQIQIKEGLITAERTGLPYIFYTESDKSRFFEKTLDEFMTKAIKIIENDPHFGAIIPARTTKSFATFPLFQQQIESKINNLLDHVMDKKEQNDYLYGPKIISKSLIPYLNNIPEDIGWGWMSYLMVLGHIFKKEIYTIPLNLPTPVKNELETQEQKLLRLKQMKDHISGIYFALNMTSKRKISL